MKGSRRQPVVGAMILGAGLMLACAVAGCATTRPAASGPTLGDAIERYRVSNAGRLATWRPAAELPRSREVEPDQPGPWRSSSIAAAGIIADTPPYFTLGVSPAQQTTQPASRPTTQMAAKAAVPAPDSEVRRYGWRKDVWHQMGYEFKSLATCDLWRGFRTSFWDLENALALTATMGASIAIRETGVDDTIRGRVHGHRQLGAFDEPIQILGHPATHFAGTGVLWLASALTEDAKEHEVAKALTQALAVNGVTTLALKAATNTRGPDNERYAWPSGHTSSAFTVAAVLNEYYGPWVGVPSLALAGLVGYQRIDSRTHDFSDVVFGAVLGYVVGTSIARDEKAQFPELFGMQVIPFADPETGTSGIALMKSW